MSQSEMKSKSAESENERLEVMERDEENGDFIVKHHPTGNVYRIVDTFAELFPMWAGRILITADSERWALTAAQSTVGFASSVIMSPAEAGLETLTSRDETVDGREGAIVQIYNRTRRELRNQMILRIGQCILTCPTTSAFDALIEAPRRMAIGRSLRLFGDGFQRRDMLFERRVWRIPVMEGEFIVEDTFGAVSAVAGGNFIIMARSKAAGLAAAEKAIDRIKRRAKGVIMPFPGGICRAGSKVGSRKYKLRASTNETYCPRLKKLTQSKLSREIKSVYEIVINGLTLDLVRDAMAEGIKAASAVEGVERISAVNFGGKLGPYRIDLKEIL